MRQVRAPGDKWHVDEIYIRIDGKLHCLWRAVDQNGNVLDVVVQLLKIRWRPRSFSGGYLRV